MNWRTIQARSHPEGRDVFVASGTDGGGGDEHTFGFNFPTQWGAAAANDILAGPPSYP